MKKYLYILLGCMITAIGVIFLNHSSLVTGGTAGLALSVSYLFTLPFSIVFFMINIPFYIFSFVRMGWKFTLSTILSVTILSGLTSLDQFLPGFTIPMWVGAIVGGLFIGVGLSVLFMNGSSLGGANILSLFLQKRYNINPGKTTFIFDGIVVLSGLYAVGLIKGLFSILSIAVISKVIGYFKNEIATRTAETKEKVKVEKKPSRVQVPAASN
ncbi:uncharacterized membrane-anchored protein YitT (DUF2179 family) [Salirhabdus euzebyi]|uniref:Uncharacterized membrane-anchored protein YitT (DUF2179 family) n=1 Tax=Salirhabdus euzebyi TaxID=394506 RepID=A0A841Q5R2_9BACI|nr:YitT family protein [Salirhabdus euzebyi]MBB6453725.1 uncharacterized membrane-anchored protein YitT (DUF2179 family) [Salirhabdus euzebyi]